MGPMPLERYREFLPGGPAWRETEALTDFFANRQCDFELQLVLDRDEVPLLEVGEDLPLGLCSWLKVDEFRHDPADAVLPVGQQVCL
jgi:type VI secretion system protein ImpH